MKIAIIQSTTGKKQQQCPAKELYTTQPRVQLAYEYAQFVAQEIYFLSATHGLVHEDTVLEPYVESFKDKSMEQRQLWVNQIVEQLNKRLENTQDTVLMLAGSEYGLGIQNQIKGIEAPLIDKNLDEWSAFLTKSIQLAKEQAPIKPSEAADFIHAQCHLLPRLDWQMLREIPFNNGIYILFEKGERYKEWDRIVRVGTHQGDDGLIHRLRDHFIKKDKNKSYFRKQIGRCLLNIEQDPYLPIWEMNGTLKINQELYLEKGDAEFEVQLENKVSDYIRSQFTFVCIKVGNKKERLRLEEGLSAILMREEAFKPSDSWLGLQSPSQFIASSGLWQSLDETVLPLNPDELKRFKSFLPHIQKKAPIQKEHQAAVPTAPSKDESTLKSQNQKRPAVRIRKYMELQIHQAQSKNKSTIVFVAGQIHQALGLKNSLPLVCEIMDRRMQEGDVVVHKSEVGANAMYTIRYQIPELKPDKEQK